MVIVRFGLLLLPLALTLTLTACPSSPPASPPQRLLGAPAAVTPGPGLGGLPPGGGPGAVPPGAFPELPLATPQQAPGTFIYAKEGNIWALKAGGTPRKLTSFNPGNFPSFPAVSPDGRSVVFTYYELPKDPKDPGGTDLYLMNSDGSEMRRLLVHDSPGSTFETPFWSPDGKSVWFTSRAQRFEGTKYLGETLNVERLDIATGTRAVALPGASSASRSADGKSVAYVKTEQATFAQSLWVAAADGSDARQLLDAQAFNALFAPSFSPDGKRLAFGAVGEPAAQSGKGPGVAFIPDGWPDFFNLSARAAEAHGVPWDLWLINADGSGLRRLTSIFEDAPYAVWSPDGKQIVFSGERAIYVVDPEGKALMRVADEFGSVGLAWLP